MTSDRRSWRTSLWFEIFQNRKFVGSGKKPAVIRYRFALVGEVSLCQIAAQQILELFRTHNSQAKLQLRRGWLAFPSQAPTNLESDQTSKIRFKALSFEAHPLFCA
jgi:hypothetical protein